MINGKVYNGFKSIEDIEKTFPELESIKVEEPVKAKTTTSKTTTTKTGTGQ